MFSNQRQQNKPQQLLGHWLYEKGLSYKEKNIRVQLCKHIRITMFYGKSLFVVDSKYLTADVLRYLRVFPKGLLVKGSLDLRSYKLTILPKNLSVQGDVELGDCPMPSSCHEFRVYGHVYRHGRIGLDQFL